MKNGLYSVGVTGLDGVDWPPGGVVVLRDGVFVGGGPYMYFTGLYSLNDGAFKGDLVLNSAHARAIRPFVFGAQDVGMGVHGTHGDDQADLIGTALVGKRSGVVRLTLRKLADA